MDFDFAKEILSKLVHKFFQMASEVKCSPVSLLNVNLNGHDESESYLRKRLTRDPSPDDSLEAGELSDALSDDEDVPGCPLPSTPEDNDLLEAEVTQKIDINFINSINHVLSASSNSR